MNHTTWQQVRPSKQVHQVYLSQREEDEGLVERVQREEREKLRMVTFLASLLAYFSLQIKTRSKRDAATVKGKQGVMYINLDGGGGEERVETFEASGLLALLPSGGEQCPSTADSSAVSLSQMAFLSMAVSIFRSPIK